MHPYIPVFSLKVVTFIFRNTSKYFNMHTTDDHIGTNRESWNKRVETHLTSEFYDLPGFLAGKTSLNQIELNLLGDVKDQRVLHLQCHFGQDSISLSRLGARVIGVDFSEKAISAAIRLAAETKSSAKFICCNLYDLANYLDEQFDIVFTSYGVIGWLPDLDKWAKIVSKFLKPNGRFVFVEFHPVVWIFDDNFENIRYRYFNSGAIIETQSGTYADRTAKISNKSATWNHSLSEVINSLIQNGLSIDSLVEYDYSPYNCFNKTVEFSPKKFRIAHLDNKIPMVYSIEARKKV